jgi:hypothetical protein
VVPARRDEAGKLIALDLKPSGGGVPLLRATKRLDGVKAETDDQRTGVESSARRIISRRDKS